jgi:glycerate dehydrogenase
MLHCPLTDENTGMVNISLLSQMKSSALLINTSRGLLVNEADLAAALNNDVIAGAAVDVVSVEPIAPENPLTRAKNLIITPHIAWATLEARNRPMQTSAENLKALSG